jgi:hypothetical protein
MGYFIPIWKEVTYIGCHFHEASFPKEEGKAE